MRTRVLLLLSLAAAAGFAAFFATRSYREAQSHAILLDQMPELAWLRRELRLTDEQYAAVRKLHLDYRPKCESMCRRIADAAQQAESLAAANRQLTPELDAALRRCGEVHADCRRAMIEHLYQTAAVLDQEQAKRYLDSMLPHALGAPQHASSCHEP